ncbi:hypothetical protein ACFVYP_40490 [Kitasatospora sp. NPDC058201]|uniref:hypothetical protein n=1 Tax=unclassified Kitasatospora TaxID=2633591 RepID=UPI00364BEBD6
MTFVAWDRNGRLVGASSDTVSNLIYTTRNGWKNLGLSIDSRSGEDAGLFGDG